MIKEQGTEMIKEQGTEDSQGAGTGDGWQGCGWSVPGAGEGLTRPGAPPAAVDAARHLCILIHGQGAGTGNDQGADTGDNQ